MIAGFHQDGPRTVDIRAGTGAGIDVVNAHEREPRRRLRGMREARTLAASRRLDVSRAVTHSFPLDEVGEAFEAARSPRARLPEGAGDVRVSP